MASATKRTELFGVCALGGAGAMLAHEIGYLAETTTRSGHGYFSLLVPLVIAGVVATFWSAALSILRKAGATTPRFGALLGLQTVAYLGFEVGERAVGDLESSLLSAPVLLGLALQPLTAWLAIRLLTVSARIVEAISRSAALVVLLVAIPQPTPIPISVESRSPRIVRLRGPPRLF